MSWNELTISWNEVTFLWNEITFLWNEVTWNDLTMERNDRKPFRVVYHLSLVFSRYGHEPLGECVYQENASGIVHGKP